MSLAPPICILYCKQCITMNEYRICWYSRFGFPREKNLCNVCICHCIFYVLLLNICLQKILYKVKIYKKAIMISQDMKDAFNKKVPIKPFIPRGGKETKFP